MCIIFRNLIFIFEMNEMMIFLRSSFMRVIISTIILIATVKMRSAQLYTVKYTDDSSKNWLQKFSLSCTIHTVYFISYVFTYALDGNSDWSCFHNIIRLCIDLSLRNVILWIPHHTSQSKCSKQVICSDMLKIEMLVLGNSLSIKHEIDFGQNM